jgi:hypothetical protein
MKAPRKWVAVGAVAGLGWAAGLAGGAIALNDRSNASEFGDAVILEGPATATPQPSRPSGTVAPPSTRRIAVTASAQSASTQNRPAQNRSAQTRSAGSAAGTREARAVPAPQPRRVQRQAAGADSVNSAPSAPRRSVVRAPAPSADSPATTVSAVSAASAASPASATSADSAG